MFTFLFIKFAHHTSYSVPSSSVKIIQAVVVNQAQVKQQMQAIEAKKQRKKEAEQAKIRRIKAQKAATEKRKLEAAKKLKAEKTAKQKVIAAKKQREVELKKQKILAEKKKQEALKQKHIAADKAKVKKIAKQKQLTKAQAEKAKALAAQRQATMQKNMQKQLAAEQQQMAAAKQMQGQVDKYKALILQVISSYWIPPPNLPKGISCKLLVTVAPGGEVLNVQMVRSSGNAALDRSAKTAVLKASPLPVPKDADLFDNFRTIRLTVRPEGVF